MPVEYSTLLIEEDDYRIFLANTGQERKEHAVHRGQRYSVDWVGQFVPPGYSQQECKFWVPMHSWAFERLILWGKRNRAYLEMVDGLVDEAVESFAGSIPDSESLQFTLVRQGFPCRCRTMPDSIPTPDSIATRINELVEKWFKHTEFKGIKTPVARYKNALMTEPITVELPVRVAATLVCCSLACEEANRGDAWHRSFYQMKGKPRKAGCRFAQGVYLYRRYTKATIEQIATVLKIPTWE